MQIRAIGEIFPNYYIEAPDQDTITRTCKTYACHCQLPADLTDWITYEQCPYLREAYATTMLDIIRQRCASDDQDAWAIPIYIRAQLEDELRRIIRCAQTMQLADEFNALELPKTAVHTIDTPQRIDRIGRLEAMVGQLTDDVHDIRLALTSPSVIPADNDYIALVRWIEQEKKAGRDWYRDAEYNRSRMARMLTPVVGWAIDVSSLCRAINRGALRA